jgi:hypothetical protein
MRGRRPATPRSGFIQKFPEWQNFTGGTTPRNTFVGHRHIYAKGLGTRQKNSESLKICDMRRFSSDWRILISIVLAVLLTSVHGNKIKLEFALMSAANRVFSIGGREHPK